MLKELLNKTYQNFYINEDQVIVGIETPKERWKIFEPAELQAHYIIKIHKCKEQLRGPEKYEPLKKKLAKYEKQLKQLTNTMHKQCSVTK